tara:strand:- start:98 stop:487 length:390 start_codon:yes stop_codon:yes gene_type:complete
MPEGYAVCMTTKEEVRSLSDEASSLLGVSRLEAIAYGLRLVLLIPFKDSDNTHVTPDKILSAAHVLAGKQGAFTMDELLDEAFDGLPVFSPHKVKVLSARLLKASGFERRQFRRGNIRPLLWYIHTEQT